MQRRHVRADISVIEWRSGESTDFVGRPVQLWHAAFEVAIAEKPAARFMIRSRTHVVKRHPEGDW